MRPVLLAFFCLLGAAFPAFSAMKAVVAEAEAFSATALAVSPDGRSIVASFSDGTVRVFDPTTGFQTGFSVLMPSAVASIAVTDGGKKLLVASGKLYLMNLTDGSFDEMKSPFAHSVQAVAADREGLFGAAASGRRLDYYNIHAKRYITGVRTPSEIFALAVDSLTQTVYAGGKDGIVRAYHMSGAALSGEASAGTGRITSIALCGDRLLIGGDTGAALLPKDLNEKSIPRPLSRHTDTVRSAASTADGRFAVTGGDDGLAVVWDLAANRAENAEIAPKLPVKAVAVDPYFRYIVAAVARNGDMGGLLLIRYTADKRQERKIYVFRDGTLTLNGAGYAGGTGLFGKYLSYQTGRGLVPFSEVSDLVHQPGKLFYLMPQPKVAAAAVPLKSASSKGEAFADTQPPVISVHERGFAPAAKDEIRVIEGQITDDSPLLWARVDGRSLALDKEGNFRIEVTVPEGGKRVILSASDIHGNSTEKAVTLTPQKAQDAPEGRKVALLVGINGYKHLPALRTPESDVHILAELLRTQYGYDVVKIVGKAATRDGVLSEINRLRQLLAGSDSLLVYYAGHGYLDPASGSAYWQLYDSAPEDDTRWLLTAQVTSNLAASGAGQIFLIADSCYSGTSSGMDAGGKGALKAVMTSGADEPVGDLGGGGHSVFARALIDALKSSSDSPYTAEALYRDVMKRMPPSAKQTPQFRRFSDELFRIK